MNEFLCFKMSLCVLLTTLHVCMQVVSNGFKSYEDIGEV
jgi:hypothetical protein